MCMKETGTVANFQNEFNVSEELQHREDGYDEWGWGEGEGGIGSREKRETEGPRPIFVYGRTSLQNPPFLLRSKGQYAVQ